MQFKKTKECLLTTFDELNFKTAAQHSMRQLVWRDDVGMEISLIFPGSKAGYKKWGYAYDYRVDIIIDGVSLSLSHANIVVDIYNKIKNGGMNAENFREVLIYAMENRDFNIDDIKLALPYTPIACTNRIFDEARIAHGGKNYDKRGNLRDLTLEELFVSIKWICLQEDVNYPIEFDMLGRKMPAARYIEAIYVCQDNTHTLSEVIYRSLQHLRPEPMDGVSYSYEKNIL